MFIAVAANGRTLESPVSEEFSSCGYLLIVNTDTLEFKAIENKGDSVKLAHCIDENNCEAVITGILAPEAFEIIAGDCVTRYDGRGIPAREALILMEKYALKLIRNPEGTDSCNSEHGSQTCDDCNHD